MYTTSTGPPKSSHSPTFTRETHSGRHFGMWEQPYLAPKAPDFDFEGLLKASIALEDSASVDQDPFSLSPLSSPDASPHQSPLSSTTSTPVPSPLLESSPLPMDDIPILQDASTSGSAAKESVARKARKKKQSCAKCQEYRRDMRRNNFVTDTQEAIIAKYVTGAVPLASEMEAQAANVTKTAYVAIDDRIHSQRVYQLEELVGTLGFKLVEWDGRTTTPIVDVSNKVIGVLAGYPGPTSEWLKLQDEALCALEDARRRSDISSADAVHRRGAFKVLRCGVSHGGGQTKPGNFRNNDVNCQIAQELNSMEPFKRFSSFATSVMATWAPKLYAYYVEYLGALHAHYPGLHRIFTSSIFSASSYNLGPRTVCFRHTDFANLPFGWCSVTALGNFNPKKGGHLVLWECGLVVEFPPGSTVLLPSATVSHCNLPISKSEFQYSFMQYMAGGLFRWVDNCFQTVVDYRASLSASEIRDLDKRNRNRWSFGLSLLSQLKGSTPSST